MCRGRAVFAPVHVQTSMIEVNRIPAERHQFGRAEAMAISDQDHGRVAMPMPVVTSRCDQLLDLFGGQVLAAADFGIRASFWRVATGN